MAFILVAKNGEEISINAWNWRPTLELIREGNILDDGVCEWLGIHGCSPEIDEQSALRIADFIESKVATMLLGTRLLYDLSVTSAPKKKVTFPADEALRNVDAVDLYSTSRQWLLIFTAFCRESGGFQVL